MNLYSNKWVAAAIFLASAVMQNTASAQQPFNLNIDCQIGGSLQATIDGYLKPLKIFPESVLNDKLASLKKVKDESAAITELRKKCNVALNDKDGIYTFFYTLDFLSKGTPYAPILSQDIMYGKDLVARAQNIASNLGQEFLKDASGVTTEFWIRLSKNNCSTAFWSVCKWAKASEIVDKVKSATVLYRMQGGDAVLEAPFLGGEAAEPFYKISIGESLTSVDTSKISMMYLKISWSNGQVSIVPLVKGVISISAYHFDLQFNNTNNWFEYKY